MGKLLLPFILAAKLCASQLRYKIQFFGPESSCYGRAQLSPYLLFPFARPFTGQVEAAGSETGSLTADATVPLAAVTNSAPDRASIIVKLTALDLKKEIIDSLECLPSESFFEQWDKIQFLLETGASPAQVRALLHRSRVSKLHFLQTPYEKLVTVVKIFDGIDLGRRSVGDVLTRPAVLRSSVQTLLSRLEFFQNMGMERGLFGCMLLRPTWILNVSISCIEERLKAFKALGLNSKEIQKAVCKYPRVLSYNFDKCIIPKAEYLESIGCGEKAILTLLARSPNIVSVSVEVLSKKVELLQKLGVANSSETLIRTLIYLCSTRCEKIQARYDWFRSKGFSFEEVSKLLGKYPVVFQKSEKELVRRFDYLENILERDKKEILAAPYYLTYNFENRIVRRFNVLRDKGLLKTDVSLNTVMTPSDVDFASRADKQENLRSNVTK